MKNFQKSKSHELEPTNAKNGENLAFHAKNFGEDQKDFGPKNLFSPTIFQKVEK